MTRTCPFKAVVFDAVGTVMFADPSPPEVYYRAAQAQGWFGTLEQVQARLPSAMRAQFPSHESRLEHGADTSACSPAQVPRYLNQDLEHRLRWRKVVAEVFHELDAVAIQRVFLQLWKHFGNARSWTMFDDVASAWDWCRDQGCEIAIASNFDSRLQQVVQGHPVLATVPCVVTSAQIGYAKPEREFYRAVSVFLNISPDQLLMVGDDYRADYEGARQANFASVWLDRSQRPSCQSNSISSLSMLPEWIERYSAL